MKRNSNVYGSVNSKFVHLAFPPPPLPPHTLEHQMGKCPTAESQSINSPHSRAIRKVQMSRIKICSLVLESCYNLITTVICV